MHLIDPIGVNQSQLVAAEPSLPRTARMLSVSGRALPIP